jgi:tetratricopeptide (TPR) repeat protein
MGSYNTLLIDIVLLLLFLGILLFFGRRVYTKRKVSASSGRDQASPKKEASKRREIQHIDAGAVIIPAGSKKYSVHSDRYKEANALLHAEKMDEAIVIFKELAALPEEAETALVGLGSSYSLKGEREQAMACYKKVIELNPMNYNAFLGMGTVNYRMAQYSMAVVYYKKAGAINPAIPDTYWGLAGAYNKLKEKELASENAKTFISMVPDSRYRKYLEGMIIS